MKIYALFIDGDSNLGFRFQAREEQVHFQVARRRREIHH